MISNCLILETPQNYFNLSIYIGSCYIISAISTSSLGGALFIETELDISLSDVTFYKCIALNSLGGAICGKIGGNLNLSRICGLNCSSLSSGQFAYFYIPNNRNISLDYVSISKCADKTVYYHTIIFLYGNILFSNDNISWNINNCGSCFLSHEPDSFFCQLTTFQSNIVTNGGSLKFIGESGKFFLINFVYNIDNSFLGIISVESLNQILFKDCHFSCNTEQLFNPVIGLVILQNCIFYPFFYSYSNVTFINLMIFETAISNMTHYYTKFFYFPEIITCHADITPIQENDITSLPIRTPFPTLSKTLIPTLFNTIESTIKPTKCIISLYLNEKNYFLIPIFVSIFFTYFLL